MVSHPQEVTDLIEKGAEAVGKGPLSEMAVTAS